MASEYTAQSFAFDVTGVQQLSGAADPSAGAGVAAAIGSIYQRTDGNLWQKTGALDTQWTVNATGGGGVTLDGAYDFGGAGVGRAITADAGAVTISSTVADNNHLLELTKNPVGAQSGDALHVVMGNTTTGRGVYVENNAVGTTQYVGGLLINTTAAVAGVPTYSPVLALEGQAWNTAAGPARTGPVRAGWQVQALSSAEFGADLAMVQSIDGAAFTTSWAFRTSTDQLLAPASAAVGEPQFALASDVDTGLRITAAQAELSIGGVSRFWVNGTAAYFDRGILPFGSTGTYNVGSTSTGFLGFYQARGSMATNTYPGIQLASATNATAGVPVQYSPVVELLGKGWDTAGVDSDEVWGALQVRPVSGNPVTGQLHFLMDTDAATPVYNSVGYVNTAGDWYFPNNVDITGKLTVGGLIDPTGLKCDQQAVDPGGTGAGEGTFWVRNDATTVPMFTDSASVDHVLMYSGAAGVTLDGAYDFGGAGVGRAITADAGAVTVSSTVDDGNHLLELTKNPTPGSPPTLSGDALHVVMGANATGRGVYVQNNAVALTQYEGELLTNTTAATAGVPKYSPAFVMEGQGWNTAAGPARTGSVKMGWQTQTLSTSAFAANMTLVQSLDGGAYTSTWAFQSHTGQMLVPTSLSGDAQVAFSGDIDTGLYLANADVSLKLGGNPYVRCNGSNVTTRNLLSLSNRTYSLGSATVGWSAIYQASQGAGTTQVTGLRLENDDAASAGTPIQYSSIFEMRGSGWDTDGAGSNAYVWGAMQVRPTTGATVTGSMHFLMDSNSSSPTYDSVGYVTEAGDWYFPNNVDITGKLTVGGLIDPTGLLCTQQAADPGATGAGEGTFWVRNDATTVPMFTDSAGADHVLLYVGSASGTLDQAYDFGGAGAGRAITADAGAVTISSTVDDGNHLLELTKDPTPDSPPTLSGSALVATMGSSATDAALRVRVNGLGSGLGTDRSRAGLILEEDSSAASSGTHNAPAIVFHVDYVGEGPSQVRNYWAVQGIQSGALDDTGYLTFGWGAGDISAAGALTNVLRLNNVVNSGVHVLESMVVTHTALASGLPATTLTVTQPADTGLTVANHTVISVVGGSVEYTTGAAVTLARVVGISPTTYTATGATQTITTAATLHIEGPPVASTNVTITNAYSLWIDSGIAVLDDGIEMVERAAVSRAVTAGRGAVWLKNTTPSSLFFTDDTAIDHDLVRQSIGEIYIYGNAAGQTLNATPGTYDIITQFNTANGYDGSSYNATNAKASNKITLNKAGTWRIQWSCSFSGTPNRTITFIVYVNGVAQNNVRFKRRLGASGDVGRAACSGFVTGVTAGQDVDVRATGDTGSESVVCESANLNCSWVGP